MGQDWGSRKDQHLGGVEEEEVVVVGEGAALIIRMTQLSLNSSDLTRSTSKGWLCRSRALTGLLLSNRRTKTSSCLGSKLRRLTRGGIIQMPGLSRSRRKERNQVDGNNEFNHSLNYLFVNFE